MDQDFEYEVRARAFELWLEGGCPHGKSLEFWEAAKRELKAQRAKQANGSSSSQAGPEQDNG